MRRFRFHIGTLVILVLLLGIVLAALRETNETWDSSIFSITLGMLLISVLLAVHRLGSRRAFWLGFAVIGSAYLGLSLVPSIESRLITTKALGYLDSKVNRSISGGFGYLDPYVVGSWDIVFRNNSQSNALIPYNGNGTLYNVTAGAGSNAAWFSNIMAGPLPNGSIGTTENFVRIGHSLLAVVAALLGGQLSRYLHTKNPQGTVGPVPAPISISNDSGV